MAVQTGVEKTLAETPTWSISAVVAIFVSASFLIVKLIEFLEKWCIKKRKKALQETIHKMKEELMLIGFVSLLLTVFQNLIATICVRPTRADWKFALCMANSTVANSTVSANSAYNALTARSTLENPSDTVVFRRSLATGTTGGTCSAGYNSFISVSVLHQLHVLIFLLALVHLFTSTITMCLAKLKLHGWKSWELETQQKNANSLQQITEISRSLTVRRQSTFLEFHNSKSWTRNSVLIWILCFFRQFGQCVTKADYLGLRLGFVTNHNTGLTFNFHSYIVRSMEDDFKTIVAITAGLWVYVTVFLFLNIEGSHLYLALSFAPSILVLLVGCKLQHVISTLALEAAGMRRSPTGDPIAYPIRPRDELFWFKRPGFMLSAVHFVLFQNAFEIAAGLWFTWQLKVRFSTCIYITTTIFYIRIAVGVCTMFLCSYSTLPLYSLVTHMGSNFKKTILSDTVKHKLHVWRKTAKRNAKLAAKLHNKDDSTSGGSNDSSTGTNSTATNSHRSSFSDSKSLNGSGQGFHPASHHNAEFDDVPFIDYREDRLENEILKSMPLSPLNMEGRHGRSQSESAARSVTFHTSLAPSDRSEQGEQDKTIAKEKLPHSFISSSPAPAFAQPSDDEDEDTAKTGLRRSHFRVLPPVKLHKKHNPIHEEEDFEDSQLSFKFLPRGSISSAPI